MRDLIESLQNWYTIHCDGDWEHDYGYEIGTLDNPGFYVRIDLADTALWELDIERSFQHPQDEQDWFQIKVEDQSLLCACGPPNLSRVLTMFFEDILPTYADKTYAYEVYLPLIGHETEIWAPVTAILINEKTLRITEIKPVRYSGIKVRDLDDIHFDQADLDKLTVSYAVGDQVEVELINVFDGVMLSAKAL
ncbi:MAG: Imm53 family immunity protein [Bacteroidota bacterium]